MRSASPPRGAGRSPRRTRARTDSVPAAIRRHTRWRRRPHPCWQSRPSRGPQATSGVALNPQPVVQLKTGDGANLPTAGVAVSVTVQGGGTLSGTSPVATDGNGLASFTDLVISGDPGTRTLVFTAHGFTSVTSSSITVAAAPPSPTQSSIVADADNDPGGRHEHHHGDRARCRRQPARRANGDPPGLGQRQQIDPASAVTGADGTATFSFSSDHARGEDHLGERRGCEPRSHTGHGRGRPDVTAGR